MKKIKADLITLTSVLVVAAFSNTSAFAFSLPGITPSGSPAFTNNVRVHLAPNGKLKIMGRGNQTFMLDTGLETMVGTGGKYTLTARFDDAGSFLSGDVSESPGEPGDSGGIGWGWLWSGAGYPSFGE